MSIRWWRSQVFVLYFATRLSSFHMSSTSLPGNHKASDICDSPEAPNIKKVKLDQCESSEKPLKDISRINVPSTAFPVSNLSPKLAAQRGFPSSAVKVRSFNTESSDTNSQEGQSHQTLKEDSPTEIEAEDTQNKAQDVDSEIKEQADSIEKASSPDFLKMEGGEEGSLAKDETVVCVTADTVATDIGAQDVCSSDDSIEAMDSQEEGDSQQTQTENSSNCDVWEQLPFFASEVDQSDEIDGSNVGIKEVEKGAAKDSKGDKKQHGKKRNKKQDEKERKPKKPPPNAFVAVRIPSPDISAKFEEVQRALQEKDERLKQVFVPAAKNHITLMVTRLNNPEEIERAKLALLEATERAKSELDLLKTPLELNFSGLGNFSKNVLFAKVAEGPSRERLISMAGIVESVFASKKLSSSSTNDFIPHLTIAKMSKKPGGRRHKKHHKKKKGKGDNSDDINELRGIDHSAYTELLNTEFGRQRIEDLELLSMTHPPTEDGYYHCYQRHSFTSSEES